MSQDEAKGFREGTKEQTHTRGSSMAGDAPTPHLGTPCHTEGHQDWINIQVERQSHGTARAFDHQNIQEDLYKLLPLEASSGRGRLAYLGNHTPRRKTWRSLDQS